MQNDFYICLKNFEGLAASATSGAASGNPNTSSAHSGKWISTLKAKPGDAQIMTPVIDILDVQGWLLPRDGQSPILKNADYIIVDSQAEAEAKLAEGYIALQVYVHSGYPIK